jgi:signal peptidase
VLVAALVLFLVASVAFPVAPVSYVTSGSMAPQLETGDGFVAVPGAVAGDPEVGDVVVYRSEAIDEGGLVTHRVVDRTEDGYITRGDANPVTDQAAGEPPVERSRVVAQVVTVGGHVLVLPEVGTVVMTLRSLGGGAPGVAPAFLMAVGGSVLALSRRV